MTAARATAIAAGIGGGLLWALAGSLLSLVNLLGLNLVYLRVTEGLDSGAAESALKARLDDAKRQAADLGQKAKDAAEPRTRERARQSHRIGATGASGKRRRHATARRLPRCPQDGHAPARNACSAPWATDDLFCGVCGHKLKEVETLASHAISAWPSNPAAGRAPA